MSTSECKGGSDEGQRRELKEYFVRSEVAIVCPANKAQNTAMFNHYSLGSARGTGCIHYVGQACWPGCLPQILFIFRNVWFFRLIIHQDNLGGVPWRNRRGQRFSSEN